MTTEDSFSFDPAIMEPDGLQGELVYDHKMLWRANLYIKENNDWNDLHPWDSDENDWNKIYDGTSALNLNPENKKGNFYLTDEDTFMTGLDDGDGTQRINIVSSTSFGFDNNDNTNPELTDAVAYSIGCHDSPFEFNSKMQDQRMLLEYDMQHSDIGTFTDGNENVSWVSTFAPGSTAFDFTGNALWKNYLDSGAESEIDNITRYPYRPGYSSYTYLQDKDNNPTNAHRSQSAGVDCVGFVVRSASYDYDNNPYDLSNVRGYIWTNTSPSVGRVFPVVNGETGNYAGSEEVAWKITDKTNREQSGDDWIYNGLERIIPGDIIYYSGHIMMVLNIEYDEESRTTTPSKIQLIEATHGNYAINDINHEVVGVTDIRSVSNLTRNWVIGRLIWSED